MSGHRPWPVVRDHRWLRERGWQVDEEWDICWLDCPDPGYLRVSGSKSICLCALHAMVLEDGCWGGDYAGAPLPPESRATYWPWQERQVAAA